MQLFLQAWAPAGPDGPGGPCDTCDCSKESITLICPTPISRTYWIGGPSMSAPVTLDSDGIICNNADVVYEPD
jgi:hypothetical protein